MSKPYLPLVALGGMAISLSADAVVYGGDPEVGFHIERPQGDYIDGDVYVDKLRIHGCDGTWKDYAVDKWVDPVQGYSVEVVGGDLCSATWYWGSDMVINGYGGFEVTATANTTTAMIDPIKVAWVLPWSVTSGNQPGNHGPELHTSID